MDTWVALGMQVQGCTNYRHVDGARGATYVTIVDAGSGNYGNGDSL